MTIVIILLAIAILLGIAGSIILLLGLNNKKNVMIISGGIMLLFTILFCTGAIFCSARVPMHRGHEPIGLIMPPIGMPMPPPCMDIQNRKCNETIKCISKEYHNDTCRLKKADSKGCTQKIE